ncbi:MAG: carboxymethylenebutenolidase [Planctomyces sp.]|nr:carboxymethylenebutenolidase [Planctomyces sp.]
MISLKSITSSLAALLLACFVATPSQSQAQDWALKRLESSPRHLEFVEIEAGKRKVNSFIAFPEVKEKAPVVIVIHEIFGLSDWVRGVTDQLAERGVIAIAPDLLSGTAPNGGGTSALGGGDGVRKAISSLPPDQITADLKAVVEYAKKLPASNGKVVVIGFCWGGGQTFRFATNTADIEAFGAFYGTGPTEAADLAKITAPVHGFYGENDARVNATIAGSTAAMKAAGKTYEPVIYKGAGHGFMRAGEAPDANEANKQARADAWKRLEAILAPLK